MPYTCGSCRSEFPSGWQAREEHCNETGHQKPSWGRDSASLNRKQPFECYTCEQQFPSGYNSRNQHCQDTGHTRPEFECDHCDKTFNTELVRFQHMREQNHFAYECRQCCDTFPSEESRVEHEADSHYLCAECDRDFASRHDVQQHLKSSAHVDFGVKCPFCNASFNRATNLTHHMESARCPCAPNMDRDTMFEFIRSRDPANHLTNNVLEWNGSKKQTLATDWAWNGQAFECVYFCHKTFNTLDGLNQHLMSPIHQQPLYHCPNRRCGREFKMLGALVNHLESECCGAMRFDRVQRGVEDMIAGGRLLMS